MKKTSYRKKRVARRPSMPRNSFVVFRACTEAKPAPITVVGGIMLIPLKVNCLNVSYGGGGYDNVGASATFYPLYPTGLPSWEVFYQKYYVYKCKVTYTMTSLNATGVTMYMMENPKFNTAVLPLLGTGLGAIDLREMPNVKMKQLSPAGSDGSTGTLTQTYYTKKMIGSNSVTDVNWWGNLQPALSNPGFVTCIFGLWETGVYDSATVVLAFQMSVRIQYYVKLFDRANLIAQQ